MDDYKALSDIARRQFQVVTTAQAERAGVPPSTAHRWVREGRWHRIIPGAFLMGPGPPDWLQQQVAACLTCGRDGRTSHRAAWRYWELDGLGTTPVEITVRYGKGSRPRDVFWHRTRQWDDDHTTTLRNLRITTVERTLVDAARFLPERTIEIGMESAIRRQLVTPATLQRFLVAPTLFLPGAKTVAMVLANRPEGGPAGSAAEVDLLRELRSASVPTPVRQHKVMLGQGQVAVLDLAWPPVRYCVEYNGIEFHESTTARVYDFDRRQALRAAGWTIDEVPGGILRHRPGAVVAMIRAGLAAAQSNCA